jgi:type IV fimbrial biogenesis protein FimT
MMLTLNTSPRANARRSTHALTWPAAGARGFTLVELLATLSVLVILTSLAAASMSSTVNNNRIYATQTEFLASLALARSEAARRGLPVMLSATAPVSGNAFGGGWRVWVDTNGNGTFDSSVDIVLRSHDALASTILIGDTPTTIGFGPMGFLTQPASVEVKMCSSGGVVGGFDLTIQPNGLADIAEVAAHTAPCL